MMFRGLLSGVRAGPVFGMLLFLMSLIITCGREKIALPCRVEQPYPYPPTSPYLGIHADRENNGFIPCSGPTSVKRGWSALDGYMILQPMSIGADGQTIYATAARLNGCKLFAIDIETGKVKWCREDFTIGVSGSAPEPDADGNIYVTDGNTIGSWLVSLTSEGTVRWRTSLEGLGGSGPFPFRSPAGLHFTPRGYAATVTVDGVVVL